MYVYFFDCSHPGIGIGRKCLMKYYITTDVLNAEYVYKSNINIYIIFIFEETNYTTEFCR